MKKTFLAILLLLLVAGNALAGSEITTFQVRDNSLLTSDFKTTNSASDESCLTYEASDNSIQYQSCGTSTLDDAYNNSASGNKVIIADDGTVTIQASGTSAGLAITRSDNSADYMRAGLFTVQSDNDVGIGATNPTSTRDLTLTVSAASKGNNGLPGISWRAGANLTSGNQWEAGLGGFSATETSWFLSSDNASVLNIRGNGNIGMKSGGRLYFDDVQLLTGNDYISVASTDNMTFTVSDNNVMSVVSNGVKIGNRETISVYDEGTFTPTVTLVGGAGNTVPQYSANEGNYIKIGRMVIMTVVLLGDGGSEGAGSGQINIAAPFNGAAFTNGQCNLGGVLQNGAANFFNIQACIEANASTIRLYKQDGVNTFSNATGADQNNTSRSFYVVFMYIANS